MTILQLIDVLQDYDPNEKIEIEVVYDTDAPRISCTLVLNK